MDTTPRLAGFASVDVGPTDLAERQNDLDQSQRRQIEQLTEAVEHRTEIGMALGMIMERFDVDHEEAFAYLVRCSSHQNRKLYDIAVECVQTRQLPQPDQASESA